MLPGDAASCEADGRPVTIAVTHDGTVTTLTGAAAVANGLALAVGESRALSPEAAACVRLPRGDAQYVFTAVHVGRDTTIAPLARFQTRGDGAGAGGASFERSTSPSASHGEAVQTGGDRVRAELAGVGAAGLHTAAANGTAQLGGAVLGAAASFVDALAAAALGDPLHVPDPSRSCTADAAQAATRPYVGGAIAGTADLGVRPSDITRYAVAGDRLHLTHRLNGAAVLTAYQLPELQPVRTTGDDPPDPLGTMVLRADTQDPERIWVQITGLRNDPRTVGALTGVAPDRCAAVTDYLACPASTARLHVWRVPRR